MKKYLLFILTVFLPFVALSQTATIRGVVKDDAENIVPFINVKIQGTSIQTTTDSTGAYELKNVPYGSAVIIFEKDKSFNTLQNVEVKEAVVVFNIKVHDANNDDITKGSTDFPTLTVGDEDLDEESSGGVSSVLSASRDAFMSAATFTFSPSRFRIRGNYAGNLPAYMNGVNMNDLSNRRVEYTSWSGLNDVLRSREDVLGLTSSYYSFGGVNGANSIDSRASKQRKQFQVSYAASNRVYANRLVLTYGSGINNKGWSYAFSYSRRWAQEGYVAGTFYDSHSFFGAIEKQLNTKQSLALTILAVRTKNGRSSPVVQEMYDLAGTNYYNPNWGYQNGEKRNAVVGYNFKPIVILTHTFNINETSSLESSLSYQFGKNKLSGIDWYKAEDPRPDYYRYLPSFDPSYGNDPGANTKDSTELANYLSQNESARQVDWNKIYQANQMHDTAKYIIANRVNDVKRYGFNAIYNNEVSDKITLSGGLTFQYQNIENYREADDLLGGNYFVNLNQFADLTTLSNPDVIQNDLNNPNQKIYKGDKYAYDYVAHIHSGSAWAQTVFKYDHIDFFLAAQLSMSGFYRTGNVKNGVFPDNSYGDSPEYNFTNPSFKGGLTYKLNGRNYFYANGAFITQAPLFDYVFVSPRTRALVVDDLKSEKISSGEAGYMYRGPRLKVRATGYYSQFNDAISTLRFYYDDLKTFVNYSITGIGVQNTGLEFSVDASIGNGFSVTAVAALGQYIFSNHPSATITQDNKDTILARGEPIYIKNLHVAGGPQSAYTVGLTYRSKKYWFVNVNVNYFDNIYTGINPVRRTMPALEFVNAGTPQWFSILNQEKRDAQFTMDVSGGWSWKLNNKFKSLNSNSYLVLNLGITNILNNTDLTSIAYEQLRFDFLTKDVNTYPAKYSYAYGTTFFASITFRFN